MNTVLAVGFQLEWDLTVYVRDGLQDRPITGPRQALKYLQDELGIRSGHSYWNAIAACSGALRYRCSPEIIGLDRDEMRRNKERSARSQILYVSIA
jgi:hypothetical protein